MRFIVFDNLKHASKVVTRVYPFENMSFFQYDKANKVFKIQYLDGSWHTIDNIDKDVSHNEKMFEYFMSSLKDKVVFK